MMTAEQFAYSVDRFGEHLNRRDDKVPSDYEFMEFINSDMVYKYEFDEIDADEYEELMKAEENAAAVKKLRLIRENFYLKKMARDPKLSTGAIFALKQPKNGGYSDKQEVSSEKVLTIKFDGVGADAGK